MRERGFEVRECELCTYPFLSSGRARYCQRKAPLTRLDTFRRQLLEEDPLKLVAHFDVLKATHHPTCQDVGKVKDYRARKRAAKGGNTRGE
jgi:hypothetical protein